MLNTNPTILHIDNSVPCDALKGIRVVELTEYVAAPACGRMLFDYGAEVIKIERPSGDPLRLVGNNTPCGADVDENPLFDVLNAGKKSIVLNLKEWEDMEVFHKLLETADIFLTNNRMISLRRMCIDPETLAQKYPALIYGLITGYGIDGSEKDDPGFDSVAFWGRSGFMASMPYEDGGYPMPTPTGVGDVITGITLLTGILSALVKRTKTGKGDFVTTSLLASSFWINNNMLLMTQPKYGAKYPISRSESDPTACCYKCSDENWIQIGIMDYDRHVPKLMEILGIPDMINDPRFSTQDTMREYWNELRLIFEKQFSLKTSDEWQDIIKSADIVCCKLPKFCDAVNDYQAWVNGNLEKYTFRNNATCVMPCPPVRFGSTGTMRSALGPRLGEHTDEVLNELKIKEC
jgi:crotonobetainyl-CoA:carnitine CoA-transferase CaiB-like acyl-CoA transferase